MAVMKYDKLPRGGVGKPKTSLRDERRGSNKDVDRYNNRKFTQNKPKKDK